MELLLNTRTIATKEEQLWERIIRLNLKHALKILDFLLEKEKRIVEMVQQAS